MLIARLHRFHAPTTALHDSRSEKSTAETSRRSILATFILHRRKNRVFQRSVNCISASRRQYACRHFAHASFWTRYPLFSLMILILARISFCHVNCLFSFSFDLQTATATRKRRTSATRVVRSSLSRNNTVRLCHRRRADPRVTLSCASVTCWFVVCKRSLSARRLRNTLCPHYYPLITK